MQNLLAYSFAIYLASLGLSPLWGAHIHHSHELSNDEAHAISHVIQQANISSPVLSVRIDKNNNCARFCDDCTIESLLEHLLENKTFFRTTSLFLVPQFEVSNLAHQILVDSQLINIFAIGSFTTANPALIQIGRYSHSISPRGPPLV